MSAKYLIFLYYPSCFFRFLWNWAFAVTFGAAAYDDGVGIERAVWMGRPGEISPIPMGGVHFVRLAWRIQRTCNLLKTINHPVGRRSHGLRLGRETASWRRYNDPTLMNWVRAIRVLFDSEHGAKDRLGPRWLFLRALGGIYFSAFFSLVFQIRGLIGPEGILPAGEYLRVVAHSFGYSRGIWFAPSLLWLGSGPHMVTALCWAECSRRCCWFSMYGLVPCWQFVSCVFFRS